MKIKENIVINHIPVYIENKKTKQLFMCVEAFIGKKQYYVKITDLVKVLKTKKEILES